MYLFHAEVDRVRLSVVFHHYRHDVVEVETFLPPLPVALELGLRANQPNRAPHLQRSSTPPWSRLHAHVHIVLLARLTLPRISRTLFASQPSSSSLNLQHCSWNLGSQAKPFDPQRPVAHLGTCVLCFQQVQLHLQSFLAPDAASLSTMTRAVSKTPQPLRFCLSSSTVSFLSSSLALCSSIFHLRHLVFQDHDIVRRLSSGWISSEGSTQQHLLALPGLQKPASLFMYSMASRNSL